jgi:hypothetical protein
MTTAQKTAPKGVTVIDRRGKKDVVYKPGDISPNPFWRMFEIYVMDFICNLLPNAKVELQKHFVNKNNTDVARVDGYIEMDQGKRRILIEIKHYTSSKIQAPTIEKIFKDQKLVKPTDYWLILSPTTPKLSAGVAHSLYKKDIKIIRVGTGWENRVMELIGEKETPGSEKIEAPTGLQIEWIFDEPTSE